MVCDLCNGTYELDEEESPEDFDKCRCGGNLNHISNLEELDDLKKTCSMCGFLNSYDSEKCHNCGKYFAKIPGYFESITLEIDIQISKHYIRVYYKNDIKTNPSKEKLEHMDEFERSKIKGLSLVKQKMGHNLIFNYENKDICLEISNAQARGIENFLNITQGYSICPDKDCSYDLNIDIDDVCPICKIQSESVKKEVYDRLLNEKKITKQENQRKKEIDKFSRGNITDMNYSLKLNQYREEAKKADILYKAYVTGGVSRLEKINGRFLAVQTLKLDVLIEQNNKIIESLEISANDNGQKNSEIIKLLEIIAKQNDKNTSNNKLCLECGTKNLPDAPKCQKCGTDMNKPS